MSTTRLRGSNEIEAIISYARDHPFNKMASGKNVLFDMVGTLVSCDQLFEAIDARFGDRLRTEGIKPSRLGYSWIEVAEREYTHFSMFGAYKPFNAVFAAMFFHVLVLAGIKEPRQFASADDLAFIMGATIRMRLRAGAPECVTRLRNAGFVIWAMTAADKARVSDGFADAGLDLPEDILLASDDADIKKPALSGYPRLFQQLSKGNQPWFVAAHKWDVSAARCFG